MTLFGTHFWPLFWPFFSKSVGIFIGFCKKPDFRDIQKWSKMIKKVSFLGTPFNFTPLFFSRLNRRKLPKITKKSTKKEVKKGVKKGVIFGHFWVIFDPFFDPLFPILVVIKPQFCQKRCYFLVPKSDPKMTPPGVIDPPGGSIFTIIWLKSIPPRGLERVKMDPFWDPFSKTSPENLGKTQKNVKLKYP